MKEIIKVSLKTRKVEITKCATDMLAVGMFSDVKGPDRLVRELDGRLNGAIGRLIELGDFKGKAGESAIVYGDGKIAAKRVLLIGLGEKKKATLDTARRAAASAAKKAVAMKAKDLSLAVHRAFGGRFDPISLGRAIGEGAHYGSYRYDEYVSGDEDGRLKSLGIEVVDEDAVKMRNLDKGLSSGAIIGRAQSLARTLANRPANVINPPSLAAATREITRTVKGLSCTVFEKKQLEAEGMGGILAVGGGSKNEPRFIILKYAPAGGAAKDKPTVAIVGKAITFDSGGISIKPAQNMDQMKLDKTGGISVIATMKAVAELGLALNVYGLVPSAENLPSGSSYRPGDIVTTYSGKTVEVLNTDAEGRMILCDALAYAAQQKCNIIIDIATLTGACMVALGKHKAGLMGNDDGLMKQLQKAADESGEKVWPMPSGDEYAEEIKSKIADLKNIGNKWGGACTAAAFLRQFVGQARWAHLDIAGMDMIENATEYSLEGSSGFGVRLLTTYLANLAGRKT